MDGHTPDTEASQTEARAISTALRAARAADTRLTAFPGAIPETLEAAYGIQAQSVEAWPDTVAGWKVGGIAPALQDQYGAKRLAGPVFSKTVHRAPDSGSLAIPAYKGFVAVEAEWVFELGDCTGLDMANLSEADIAGAIKAAHIGVELASSPLKDINDYGPAVIISDFGNNFGAVIGRPISDWSSAALSAVDVSVEIDGKMIGQATALPGLDGPLGAVKFLIEHLSAKGVRDFDGLYVSSGAITGVHECVVGASSVVTFKGLGEIALDIVPHR